MPARLTWIVTLIFCAGIFSWSLYRDILAERQYPGDLRNRVVGARLQQDGRSPYFYKWQKEDGLRYYDPNNFQTVKVSSITASPFFHDLLLPIANWPERKISIYWLAAEYAMLLIMIALGLSLAGNRLQQWMVLITGFLFLFTEAWKMHLMNGQNYLFIPLLALCFYWSFRNRNQLLMAFIAGLSAVALVLIKPTALVFFVPFIFLLKYYSWKYRAMLFLPLLIAGVWICSSSKEMYLWKQYRLSLVEQVKVHQHVAAVVPVPEPDPRYTDWEGINLEQIKKDSAAHPLHFYSENGNFFVVVEKIFHKKLSVDFLMTTSAVLMLVLLFFFYRSHAPGGFNLPTTALAGFSLYMITDLFSPVFRHQYYAAQWLFPLLLTAAVYPFFSRPLHALLAFGLLLNIVNIDAVPMEHTIGEYIMLFTIIVLSLRRQIQPVQ